VVSNNPAYTIIIPYLCSKKITKKRHSAKCKRKRVGLIFGSKKSVEFKELYYTLVGLSAKEYDGEHKKHRKVKSVVTQARTEENPRLE